MGQKSSKKVDIYATENATLCHLLPDDVSKYVGRPREYTAVDVWVEEPEKTVEKGEEKTDTKKKSPKRVHPNSIIKLLTKAHRKSYHLAFIVPKVKGGKSSRLGRNSFIKEESENGSNDVTSEEVNQFSHTVFLLRPKVKSRLKKEFSLKRMEAKKTFLNIMMDVSYSWIFTTKDYVENVSKIPSGNYVKELQKLISEQAAKGGRLLTVMCVDDTATPQKQEDSTNIQTDRKLHLRMVFLHKNSENPEPVFEYKVKCVGIQCTEQKLKPNKKQNPAREANISWTTNWLSLFEAETKLTEVINVGELPTAEEPPPDKKGKKIKIRSFEVTTLCFYESLLPDNNTKKEKNEDDDDADDVFNDVAGDYEGLVREVWAPVDDTVQENLESEAEKYGEYGWELSTVLVTSHVRSAADNQKQLRKFAIFFQRPKEKYISKEEREKSRENLIENELGKIAIEESHPPQSELLEEANIPPTSPKEKVERFGIAMMPQVDLGQAKKLKTASPKKEATKSPETPVIAKVQLKKVNRDEIKKETAPQVDTSAMSQVKLRPTETNATAQQRKSVEKENVPWLATLEKKREAVMKVEPKTPEMSRSSASGDEITKKYDELQEKRNQRQIKKQNKTETTVVPTPVQAAPSKKEDTITPKKKSTEEIKSSQPLVITSEITAPKEPTLKTADIVEDLPSPPEDNVTDNIEVITSIPGSDKETETQSTKLQHSTENGLPEPVSNIDFTEIVEPLPVSDLPPPIDMQKNSSQQDTNTSEDKLPNAEEILVTPPTLEEVKPQEPIAEENMNEKTLSEESTTLKHDEELEKEIMTTESVDIPNPTENIVLKNNQPHSWSGEVLAELGISTVSEQPKLTDTQNGESTEIKTQEITSTEAQEPTENIVIKNIQPGAFDGQQITDKEISIVDAPLKSNETDDNKTEQASEKTCAVVDDLPAPPPLTEPSQTASDLPSPETYTSTLNTVLSIPSAKENNLETNLPEPEVALPPEVPVHSELDFDLPLPVADFPPPLPDIQTDPTFPPPDSVPQTEDLPTPLPDSPQNTATPCEQPHTETSDELKLNGPVDEHLNAEENELEPPLPPPVAEDLPLHDQEPLSVLYLPSPPPITDDFYQDETEVQPPADAQTTEDTEAGEDTKEN